MNNKFAQILKELRMEKGLTQQQLADKLHTTQRKVSYWEQQKVEPDLNALIDLSNFFDVSIDYLVGKSDI